MTGRDGGGTEVARVPDLASTWWDRHRDLVLYSFAVVSYVVAGVAYKPLLNWIVGPLWFLLVAWLVPDTARRALRRFR